MTNPPPASPARGGAPAELGKYRLVRELGRGGMGVVYEAFDSQLQRRVALKLMITSALADLKEQALEEERFLREARLSARLKHPNIVTVYETGVLDGRHYLAMELVDGQPLSAWWKRGSITLRQQVVLLRDVALAIEDAHRQGILHRDLKPANVLIDARNRPHVTDFGLAKLAGEDAKVSLTASGMVVGTPSYMSPEQARGLKTVDRRTDVYSLGVMLYEMLAGRPPFEGATPIEVIMKVVKSPVIPPSRTARKWADSPANDAVENICLRALAKNPKQRYGSAKAFADDLTRWLKGEQVRVKAPAASHGWVWALAAAAAAAGIAVVFLLPTSRPGEATPREDRGAKEREAERLRRDADRRKDEALANERERLRLEDERRRAELARRDKESAEAEEKRTAELAAKQTENERLRAQVLAAEERARAAEEAVRRAADKPKEPPPPARAEPARNESPKPAPPPPPKEEPSKTAATPAPPKKPAEPSTVEKRTAERAIKILYKDEYLKRMPADQRLLAARLLEHGQKPEEETTTRFVLIEEARDLALQAGGPELAFRAADALVRTFAVDPRAQRRIVLDGLLRGSQIAMLAREAAEACRTVSEEAVGADDYEAALQLLAGADAMARRTKDPAFVTSLQTRAREVAEIQKEFGRARGALRTLQDKPDDPVANLTVGRFRCFVKQDWEGGLPHLARGSDDTLRMLAQKDLDGARGAPETQASLAESWWGLAEKHGGPLKALFQDRGLSWYKRSWPGLTGAVREQVRGRFKAMQSRPGRATGDYPARWSPHQVSDRSVFSLDESHVRSGRYSLRVKAGTTPSNLLGGLAKPIPGRRYVFSAWILTEGNVRTDNGLYVNFADAEKAFLSLYLPTPGDQPWWTRVEKIITIPPTATHWGAFIPTEFLKSGTMWIDDYSLKAVDDGIELIENGGFEQKQ